MRRLAYVLIAAVCVLVPSFIYALAPAKNTVKSIRYKVEGGKTKIYVDLTGPSEFKCMRLKEPERLCIDISNVVIEGGSKNLDIKDGFIKSIRTGQFNPNTVRVVIEFEGVRPPANEGVRPPEAEVKNYDIKQVRTGLFIEIPYVAPQFALKPSPPVIVVDAGHGGHDPGAIGPKGLMEKDVTLAIALKVKRILEKEMDYKVYLTRSKDEYLDLEKRAQIANKRSADIFVSIHANANPNRQARGVESYILNWTDDEEAMKVAARENAISFRRMKEARSEVGAILASLELQSKRDDSLELAYHLQNSLIKNMQAEHKEAIDLGVKQALFYVLIGARMPSVLVEVSFISNPEEEQLLRKNSYRESIAQGIAAGVAEYLKSVKSLPSTAYSRSAELALKFK